MNVKDIREFGRLVKDTAISLQSKEMRNLLGSVTVPLVVSPHCAKLLSYYVTSLVLIYIIWFLYPHVFYCLFIFVGSLFKFLGYF